MRQAVDVLEVNTSGKGLYEVTRGVRSFLGKEGVQMGLLTVFCRHTSASLLIQENADPDVQTDLQTLFRGRGAGGRRLRAPVRKGRTTCRPTSARR